MFPVEDDGELSPGRKFVALFLEGSGSIIGRPVAVVVVLQVQVDILLKRPEDDWSGVLGF
jgi:hypothetical protein